MKRKVFLIADEPILGKNKLLEKENEKAEEICISYITKHFTEQTCLEIRQIMLYVSSILSNMCS